MATNKNETRIQMSAADVRVLISNIEANDKPVPSDPKTWKKTKWEPARRFFGSRYIGLLLGPLYGAMLYYYFTYMLLSGLPLVRSSSMVNDTVASVLSSNQSSLQWTNETVRQIAGGCVGVGAGAALTVGGCYSPKTRTTMMLMIPSLLSGRGRSVMISVALGLLLEGPVATIEANIQQVVDSLTCMYETIKDLADQYVEQFQKIMKQINELIQQVNDMVKEYTQQLRKMVESATAEIRGQIQTAMTEVKKRVRQFNGAADGVRTFLGVVKEIGRAFCAWMCDIPDILPEFDTNIMPDVNLDSLKNIIKDLLPDINLADLDSNWKNIAAQLQGTSIAAIREKLKKSFKFVFNIIREYSQYASKVFYLSLLLMIVDAIRYLQNYYSDDSFDNMYVDDNLRMMWWTGGKEKLLPLRNWELNEKYQYSTAFKLSKSEAKRIIIQSIPTLLFMLIAICIIVSDSVLSSVLQLFKKEAQFGIALKGMKQGITFQSLLPGLKSGTIDVLDLGIKGFNLSTDKCLPTPAFTDHTQTGVIIAIIVVCLLSCIFDAYGLRLRAKICNLFFGVRAGERAEYLYKRIQTGRKVRRIQLHMVVSQELAKRDRQAKFCCARPGTRGTCPACYQAMAKGQPGKPFSVTVNNVKRETHICDDCYKDVN